MAKKETAHNPEEKLRIGFIGSGVMSEVMIKGLVDLQVVPPDRIWAAGPRSDRADDLHERYGIHGIRANRDAVANADLVVLSVKPQSLAKVLKEIKEVVEPRHLVLSIVAGARMEVIGSGLAHPAIIRCMPNLPCQIHRGMTIWTSTPEVRDNQREIARRILRTMGAEYYVQDELDVDRATAVNGTGPAIIAYIVKALEDAALFIGESRPLARESVLQTIIGTAEMILQSDRHVAELIDGVTSPGGTTSRALHILSQGRTPAIFTDAIDAAFQRSLELGRDLDGQVRNANGKG
jgi:pyrroline-5-carboxylate reductase